MITSKLLMGLWWILLPINLKKNHAVRNLYLQINTHLMQTPFTRLLLAWTSRITAKFKLGTIKISKLHTKNSSITERKHAISNSVLSTIDLMIFMKENNITFHKVWLILGKLILFYKALKDYKASKTTLLMKSQNLGLRKTLDLRIKVIILNFLKGE